MDKNKWIDETMNSTDGMQRATPSDDLFSRIEQRIAAGVSIVRTVSLRTVSMAAASIVLLVAANIFMLQSNVKEETTQKDGVETVIEYYGLNEKTINY